MKTVITFGTFDLFHIGHLNILKRAAKLGDTLIVGVSSDEFTNRKKGRYPIIPEADRIAIVESIKGVDSVFIEESLEQKREYITRYNADILVMGDDWKGAFDYLNNVCSVVYLSRTPGVCTTDLIKNLQQKI